MNRTRDELKAAITGLEIARQSKEVQLWIHELELYKERVIAGSCNLPGEEAVRAMGMLKGLSLAINLEKVLVAENNVGNPTPKIHTV